MSKLVKIAPLSGYALVKPEEAEEKTVGGIFLPSNAQERPARGKVVAVGSPIIHPNHEEKAQFKVGDSVIYKKWGGDELKVEGTEYKLVKFDDVMAIIES